MMKQGNFNKKIGQVYPAIRVDLTKADHGHHAAFNQNDPKPPAQRIRGLGDLIAAGTKAVGIRPCGGCKKRQEALNRMVPFGKKDNNGGE